MQDVQLYQQILCISSSWLVSGVEVTAIDGEVGVCVVHDEDGNLPVPNAGHRLRSMTVLRSAPGDILIPFSIGR